MFAMGSSKIKVSRRRLRGLVKARRRPSRRTRQARARLKMCTIEGELSCMCRGGTEVDVASRPKGKARMVLRVPVGNGIKIACEGCSRPIGRGGGGEKSREW